jgi:hypothetical protein
MKRFRQKSGVKRCVFCDNAVFAKMQLCRGILHLNIFFFNPGPRPCPLLNDAQKMWKRTTKSRACVPLRAFAGIPLAN